MSLKRMLGLALIIGLTLPLVACEDTTTPPPPPPGPQVDVVRHYRKAVDDDGRTQIGLQNNDVYDVLVSTGGSLWVGNQEGIAVFNDPRDTRRTGAFDQNNGLPNPKVRVFVESDGILYVGTWGGGIGAYDIGAGTWEILDTGDGLVNDLVADMKVDDDGSIIIATNNGVSRYSPATGQFSNYRKAAQASTIGDLLDPYVSALEIADTPRGKEYWYMPRWESGITAGDEGNHGITVSRGAFNAPVSIDTLQAVLDNSIYEHPDGALANGAGQYLSVGRSASGINRRTLIKFDVAGVVPDDARVLSARLRFRNTTSSFAESRLFLFRVLKPWGEGTSDAGFPGTSGAPATPGDATWKHNFYPDSEWNSLGGDFEQVIHGITDVRGTGFYTMNRTEMAQDVQAWVNDPSSNHGWMLLSADSTKVLSSRENSNVNNRPTLEVRYARFFYLTEVETAFPSPNVNDVYYDETSDLFYIAFSTEGLGVVDVGNSTWTFYTTDQGLPSNVIYSVADVGGTIWVATQNGVARQLADGSFRGYNRGGGLPGDRVRRVYTDQPDRLWIGLVSAGAAWLDPGSAE